MILKEFKYNLKKEGLEYLLKNPSKSILLPLLILSVIFNRLKFSRVSIYILEMKIDRFNQKNNYKIFRSADIGIISRFIHQREKEEKLVHGTYKNDIEKRIENGDSFIASAEGEDIVSVMFLSTRPRFYDLTSDNTIEIPEGHLAVYDIYTLKEFRGKGIFSNSFMQFSDIMAKEGFNTMVLWVMPHNKKAIKLYYNLGFKKITKKMSLLKFFGIRFHKVKDFNRDAAENFQYLSQ